VADLVTLLGVEIQEISQLTQLGSFSCPNVKIQVDVETPSFS